MRLNIFKKKKKEANFTILDNWNIGEGWVTEPRSIEAYKLKGLVLYLGDSAVTEITNHNNFWGRQRPYGISVSTSFSSREGYTIGFPDVYKSESEAILASKANADNEIERIKKEFQL